MPGSVTHPPAETAGADLSQPRCVLFSRPGQAVPSDLLNSLARRIGRIASCTDAYTAMAEVCAVERDRATSDPALPAATVLVLIEPHALSDAAEIVSQLRLFAPAAVCWKFESSANPRLSAIVDADVATWTAKPSPPPPPNATAAGQPSRRTGVPPAPAPRLRIAGASLPDPSGPLPDQPEIVVRPQPRVARSSHPPGGSTPLPSPPNPMRQPPPLTLRGVGRATSDDSAPPPPRPALTAEELRMLLGDDPAEHGPMNGATGGAP